MARNGTGRSINAAGFDHIRIETARNDWFLNPDLPDLLTAIDQASRGYVSRRGVGYSMGGYGLLIVSRAIRIDQALFLSPHTTPYADLPTARPLGDGRFEAMEEDGVFLRDAHDIIRGSGRRGGDVAILYDPLVEGDRPQAREVARHFEAPRLVRLGGAGHPVTRRLSNEMAVRVVNTALTAEHLTEGSISRAVTRAIRQSSRERIRLVIPACWPVQEADIRAVANPM